MIDKEKFINALKSGDQKLIEEIPKSDIHNHATRGGNINYVLAGIVDEVPICPGKLNGLDNMQIWYDKNVKPHCQGKEGFERRIRGAFLQAKNDGITELVLSFGIGDSVHYSYDYKEFINCISKIHKEIAPSINFYPELSFSRTNNIEPILEIIDEILNLDFFRSVDLTGNDMDPVYNFIKIYRKAKLKGLVLKAHVGEFGSAESIKEVVEILDLDEVQHGINAIHSKEVMDFLKERKTILNICPSSNVILGIVKDYKDHPIGKLYRYGIPVTINSDDMLIFNNSVSDDYLKLLKSAVLEAEELNEIREFGIMVLKKINK